MLLFFFFPFETLECPSIPLFLTQHVDANTCKILLLAEWGGGRFNESPECHLAFGRGTEPSKDKQCLANGKRNRRACLQIWSPAEY